MVNKSACLSFCVMLGKLIWIYLLFYVAFNSQGDIVMSSLQVEETSADCTVNHRESASNYELSNTFPRFEPASSEVGGENSNPYTTDAPGKINTHAIICIDSEVIYIESGGLGEWKDVFTYGLTSLAFIIGCYLCVGFTPTTGNAAILSQLL